MSEKKFIKPLQRHYISALDRFLHNFDKKPEAYSESRLAEELKYQKIGKLRDNPSESQERDLFGDF